MSSQKEIQMGYGQTNYGTLESAAQAWADHHDTATLVLVSEEITRATMMEVRLELLSLRDQDLDIFLCSPGGDAHSAYKIANLIHAHANTTRVFVVNAAKSAATLITICMDEIVMGETAELGPIDTQRVARSDSDARPLKSTIDTVQGMQLARAMASDMWTFAARYLVEQEGFTKAGAFRVAAQFVGELNRSCFNKVHPDHFGDLARMLDVARQYAIRLLVRHRGMAQADATRLANSLVEQFPSHGFVIDLKEAQLLKLNARSPSFEEELGLVQIEVNAMRQSATGLVKLFEPTPKPVAPPSSAPSSGNTRQTTAQTPNEANLQ